MKAILVPIALVTMTIPNLSLGDDIRAERDVAKPLSEVIGIRAGIGPTPRSFLFLRTPQRYVDACALEGGVGIGKVTTKVFLFSLRNGAWAGQQDIVVRADGSVSAADGGPSILDVPRTEAVRARFERRYTCYVPILTEAQLAEARIDPHAVAGLLPYDYDDIPRDVFPIERSDLFRSYRYRDFTKGPFTFNSGFSGGIDPYLKGTSIGAISERPGTYGAGALYYVLSGDCSRGDFATVDDLQRECGEDALLRAADEASRGLGLTVAGLLR